jgi:hypothetical protein
MERCVPKVAELRARFPDKDIEVDGGVSPKTVDVCAQAGTFHFCFGQLSKVNLKPALFRKQCHSSWHRYLRFGQAGGGYCDAQICCQHSPGEDSHLTYCTRSPSIDTGPTTVSLKFPITLEFDAKDAIMN